LVGLPTGVWVAAEGAWDDMMNAEDQLRIGGPGAELSMMKLFEEHRIALFPVGTRVRVLATSFTARKIMILDGERKGDEGWVPTEHVEKIVQAN